MVLYSEILNQTEVLSYYDCDHRYMMQYIGKVYPNDKHNFEAKSARHYIELL